MAERLRLQSGFVNAKGKLDTHLEVWRDDLRVFEDSPSALCIAIDGTTGGVLDDGSALVDVGRAKVRVDVGFRRDEAVRLRDEITCLLDGWPEDARG